MRRIPRVVAHKSRRGRRNGAPPETTDAVRLDTLPEDGGASGPLSLERSFQSVDGCQSHPEGGGAEGSEDILDGDGQTLEKGVGLEEGVDAGVGGGVAETGCWSCGCALRLSQGLLRVVDGASLTLKESSSHSIVVPTETTLSVESLGGSGERGAEAVLIVHDGS